MAKEFENLREVIRDISGDVERMSSDEKLIKELEKYIKEDPLAFLGWQMYKMNLVDMKTSKQQPGENLIRFNDGRKIEIGGIYSPKGLKVIPVRTGFEKSENVAVFDEDAPVLGSVALAKGAREENLELLTVLHELRHVASRHLQIKYSNEYFDEETDRKVEEDQQRILDLYTLISTGDYKDGNLSTRGAQAFADSKDFAVSLLLAQKSARLALRELDSLNVSVPDKMKNSVKKMKTVFEYELGESDRQLIGLVKESFERVKSKEKNGDANMMELDSAPISDEVLNTTIEHIHVYESQAGELKGKDPIGGTESEFHMKVGIAKIYDKSLSPMTQEQFDKTVSSERKRELAKQHVLAEAARMKSNGIDFNVLKTGESVALLSTLYNYGNQPNTTRCYSYLSEARKKRPDMTKEFEVQAMNSLDVARIDGEISMGAMQRTISHQETFRGELNVTETYRATPDYTAQEQADLYADITGRSKECKSFADIVKKNNLLDDGTEIIYITEPTEQAEPPAVGFTEQPKEVVDIDMFPAPEVIKGDMQ